MIRRSIWPKIYCLMIILFLFAPTVVVVLFAFESSGDGTLPFDGFTLNWFKQIYQDEVTIRSFRTSAIVALFTALVSITIGTLAAYGLFRRRSRWGQLIVGSAILPLAFPYLVIGIALLSMFHFINMRLSVATVVVGHVLVTLPAVIVTINARFSIFDPALEEASRDLGASAWRTFFSITFPLIRSSVIGAGLLALALSLDEFIVTLFTTGGENTVPMVIWAQMRRGVSPSVNAISSVLLVSTVLLILTARKLAGASLMKR